MLFKRKFFEFGMTLLIFSNLELKVIIKIIQSLGDSGLLIKSVTKTVENEVKEQKRRTYKYARWYISSYFTRKYVSR